MPRFFVAASNIFGGVAYLNAKDFEHIKVLRLKQGELVTVCDGRGWDYACRVKDAENELEVVSIHASEGEPNLRCELYCAFPKGDKADMIVQKAAELGASSVTFFESVRCVSRPQPMAALKKCERWQKISEEAAKQSGRGIIPEVRVMNGLDEVLVEAAKCDIKLFLYENERENSIKTPFHSWNGEIKSVSVITGSEGGFEPEEALSAKAAGLSTITIGKRILRCETAPLAALTAVMLLTDNI